MRIFIFMYHHIDDIIFRGRNKRYGAYNLRATYDLRLARAMFFSISAFVLVVCAPFLFTREFKVYEIVAPKSNDLVEVIVDYVKKDKIDFISGIQQGRSTPVTSSQPNPDNYFISNSALELPMVDSSYFRANVGEVAGGDPSDVFGSETGELNGTAKGEQGSTGSDATGIVEKEKEEVFIRVDQMPVFGSGMNDLFAYLSKEIKYPAIARQNGIYGTVVIQFVIDRNGNVTNADVLKGIGGGCDQEALRVVKKMPAWSPGKQQGRAVSVKFTLPVMFKLQS
ncbi:MAG: energy transducer TonB [Saprospiraceae bacterium]|nr:energy transducer TonB [Saprospiraceae bacterium]